MPRCSGQPVPHLGIHGLLNLALYALFGFLLGSRQSLITERIPGPQIRGKLRILSQVFLRR